ATLNIAGNTSNYGFLWTPDLGVSNGLGNARTGLPASHYVVLVTYNGNDECVRKFEFDIFDDCAKCAPVFATESMTVEVVKAPALVCVPAPLAVLSQTEFKVDGGAYPGQLVGCDKQDVMSYGFDALPAGQLMVKWRIASDSFFTMADDLWSVVNFMNEVDGLGNWYFDVANNHFVSPKNSGAYGKLQVTHLPTGVTKSSKLKYTKLPLGTSLRLSAGTHLLTTSNAVTGCLDSMVVIVKMKDEVAIPDTFGLASPSELNPDLLRTKQGETVRGNVLANDELKRPVKQLAIAKQPTSGKAWVNVDNTVSYRPLVEYCNSYKDATPESFTYEICFDDGSKLRTTVTVEVECRDEVPTVQDIVLYPNPADRYAFLDVSALVGQTLKLQVYNNLGVTVHEMNVEEAPTAPIRIELGHLPPGHYAVWVRPMEGRPFVRQLIINR
ncbi:MAG: hypothetical protein IT258_06620, partial [Saprospiraceae bacterium]|nr:hypothetical protein [Saprospiraceae bacterium]